MNIWMLTAAAVLTTAIVFAAGMYVGALCNEWLRTNEERRMTTPEERVMSSH